LADNLLSLDIRSSPQVARSVRVLAQPPPESTSNTCASTARGLSWHSRTSVFRHRPRLFCARRNYYDWREQRLRRFQAQVTSDCVARQGCGAATDYPAVLEALLPLRPTSPAPRIRASPFSEIAFVERTRDWSFIPGEEQRSSRSTGSERRRHHHRRSVLIAVGLLTGCGKTIVSRAGIL
jgi:hypothetical protein